MEYHELLRDDLTLKEAAKLQEKYIIILKEQIEKGLEPKPASSIKRLAGVDISYIKINNKEWGIACAVLWNLEKNQMEEFKITKGLIRFPYEPGFLGFRESRLISEAINCLSSTPDLIMCDGHGVVHPKRFGEAVQLGFALGIPSCGIAKNPFAGYSDWKSLLRKRGNKVPIWTRDPTSEEQTDLELLGYSMCLLDGAKPVFISTGYRTVLHDVLNICLKTSFGHRQPEPLFLADRFSRHEAKLG
ncbi:MAG: endonuclease V [Promethearchaeota archaeon]